ncbi:MAG: hypothetical protein WC071_04480 [Victivallaceae bacterium]
MKKLCLYLIIALSSSFLLAEVPAVDGCFTLKSGKYAVDISGKLNYCIYKINYDGVDIGNNNGFYGTILAPASGKFIGAGHTEGGAEKVLSIKLTVDGAEKAPDLNAVYTGASIVFEDTSMLGNLKVFKTITITPVGIRIDKSFEAVEDQKIYSFYIFQYCFSENTNEWIIGRPDDSTTEGIFKSDDGWHLRSEKELLWFALYHPDSQKGILGYFISYYPKQGQCMFWDKKVYHKFYYWAALPPVVDKGYKSRQYSMFLRGINAGPDNWKSDAIKISKELKAQYPLPLPPKAPDNITLNFENSEGNCKTDPFKGEKCLELKGNGKFLAKKIPLTLEKNQDYTITFSLKKGENTSSESNKNYLIVGQYDKARKFHAFVSLGNQTGRDGKWHEITGTFKTPALIEDCNLYIYNINTTDSIYLDEIEIKKIKE